MVYLVRNHSPLVLVYDTKRRDELPLPIDLKAGDGVDETLRWASLPSTPARAPVRLPTEKASP